MQVMYSLLDGNVREFRLPAASEELLPGIAWGAFDELLTPAWWSSQCWQQAALGRYRDLRLGRDLREELTACLLGGYGMPAELGLAAYASVRDAGLLQRSARPTVAAVEDILSRPMPYGAGHRNYRFPHQKARYLAGSLERLSAFDEPTSDKALRDALATFPGVGLKTASWVVRNYRRSDTVAVLDVHILRAGRAVSLFPGSWRPQSHYRPLEERFLTFANAISTAASLLDAVMWDFMRRIPQISLTPVRAVG